MGVGTKQIIKITAQLDVLLAAGLLTAYVSVMSENLPELQLVKGSKRDHAILYIYVAFTAVVQLLVAFKYYRVLTHPDEDNEDDDGAYIGSLLRMSKFWIIISYLLLINWTVKAGVYTQKGNRGISIALFLYLIEITFRICSICIVNSYINQLEKEVEERKAEARLRSVISGSRMSKIKEDQAAQIEEAKY